MRINCINTRVRGAAEPVADDEKRLVEVHFAVVVVGPVVRAAGAHAPVCFVARWPMLLLLLRSWGRRQAARIVPVRGGGRRRVALLLVLHAAVLGFVIVVVVSAVAAVALHGTLYVAMRLGVGAGGRRLR
jgi:hypothetical protein